jgi:hypothetical protein
MTEAQTRTASPPPADAPLVEVLLHMLDAKAGQEIRLSDLLEAMGHRGYGFVFIAFGVLAAISPPGLGSLMSLPVMLFAAQMLWGAKEPWVPARLNRKTFAADTVRKAIERARPWLRRIEIFARPRLQFLAGGVLQRLAALVCIILACVILVPGPGTNNPPGVAIAIFGFALAEKDGILMLLAFIAAVLAFFIGLAAIIAVAGLAWAWMTGVI